MRILLSAVLLVTLAACDTAGPAPASPLPPVAPEPPPALRAFDLPEVATGFTVEAGTVVRAIPASFFGMTTPPRNVTFEARSADPSIATVELGRIELFMTGVSAGTVMIGVDVRAPGYRDTTVTFPLTVSALRCPSDAPDGTADAFPVDVPGTVWRFSYSSTETEGNGDESRIQGEVQMQFGPLSCTQGTRQRSVTYSVAGQRSLNGQAGSPVSIQVQGSLSESASNQAVLTIPLPAGMVLESRGFSRYRPTTSLPTFSVGGFATCLGRGSSDGNVVELRSGRGLIRAEGRCETTTQRTLRFAMVRID